MEKSCYVVEDCSMIFSVSNVTRRHISLFHCTALTPVKLHWNIWQWFRIQHVISCDCAVWHAQRARIDVNVVRAGRALHPCVYALLLDWHVSIRSDSHVRTEPPTAFSTSDRQWFAAACSCVIQAVNSEEVIICCQGVAVSGGKKFPNVPKNLLSYWNVLEYFHPSCYAFALVFWVVARIRCCQGVAM